MYLVIARDPDKNGTPVIERKEGVPGFRKLQEIVGGGIEGATFEGAADGRMITGYVNGTGLLDKLPLILFEGAPRVSYLAGPVVITATDETGETVPLTEEEAGRFTDPDRALIDLRNLDMIPVITYTPEN